MNKEVEEKVFIGKIQSFWQSKQHFIIVNWKKEVHVLLYMIFQNAIHSWTNYWW